MVATMILIWILIATGVGGVLSAALAGSFALLPERQRARLLPHLVSFATGAMLAAALLALLPEAVAAAPPARVGAALLAGIALFFVLEKLVLWRHCHTDDCESHVPSAADRDHAAGRLVLVGDAVHNAFDGVLIAAAFLTDLRLGLVTTIAITAHEVPQELGDMAVLLHSGMKPGRALFYNMLSGFASVLGGLVGYLALSQALAVLPYATAVAAASLIYVAVADLIPGLHRRVDPQGSLMQVILIALGVATIALMQRWLG
jgi:zinc and cadmium transporter